MTSSISQTADLTADGAEDADAKPEQPMNAPASVRDADHCWRIRARTTNFRLPIFNSQSLWKNTQRRWFARRDQTLRLKIEN
jgi:hypothetical protein